MNNKTILKEIEKWNSEKIITDEQADILSGRYSPKSPKKAVTLVFSILGSLLIAAGIITISIAYWKNLPQGLKGVISIAPLIFGQIFATIVILKKNSGAGLREGAAIFWSAAVFGSYKLIEMSTGICTPYYLYMLICAAMIVPVAILLHSVIPYTVYFFAVISAGVNMRTYMYNVSCYAVIAIAVAAGLIIIHKSWSKGSDYGVIAAKWISVIAVFSAASITAEMLNAPYMLFMLIFFCLILIADRYNNNIRAPYLVIGTLGSLIMLIIYSACGSLYDDFSSACSIVLAGLTAAVIILSVIFCRKDIKKMAVILSGMAAIVLSLINELAPGEFIDTLSIFIITFAVYICGIVYMANGIKHNDLITVNIGLLAIIAQTVIRLSDDMGMIAKGVGFLVLGIVFISFNVIMLRKNNKSKKEAKIIEK